MKLRRKKNLNNIRYVKQQDNFSCGPVAILNILKWGGYDLTSLYLPVLKRICKTDIDGTPTEMIDKALKRYSAIKSKCVSHIKISDLHKHIEKGGAALIEISWFDEKHKIVTGHFYVIIGVFVCDNYIYYRVVNWDKKESLKIVKREEIVQEFRKCIRSEDNPKAWLINRT